MDRVALLKRVAEVLDYSGELMPGQSLEETGAWDSLGRLSILALFEELGVEVDTGVVGALKTTDELLKIVESALHD